MGRRQLRNTLSSILMLLKLSMLEGGGYVDIELLSYTNPDHTISNGDCCEPDQGSCRICNNRFEMCLGNGTINSCNFGKHRSSLFDDTTFPNTKNSQDQMLTEPIRFSFAGKWEGHLNLSIKVLLSASDQLVVDFDPIRITTFPSLFKSGEKKNASREKKFRRKSSEAKRIFLSYKVECDDGFKLPDCFDKVPVIIVPTQANTSTPQTITATVSTNSYNLTRKEVKTTTTTNNLTIAIITTSKNTKYAIISASGLVGLLLALSLCYYYIDKRKKRRLHPQTTIRVRPAINETV